MLTSDFQTDSPLIFFLRVPIRSRPLCSPQSAGTDRLTERATVFESRSPENRSIAANLKGHRDRRGSTGARRRANYPTEISSISIASFRTANRCRFSPAKGFVQFDGYTLALANCLLLIDLVIKFSVYRVGNRLTNSIYEFSSPERGFALCEQARPSARVAVNAAVRRSDASRTHGKASHSLLSQRTPVIYGDCISVHFR